MEVFLRELPQMDPKLVRTKLYHLSLQGKDLSEIQTSPPFLSNLTNFPAETLSVILKYKFPPIIEGDLFFLKTPQVNDWILYICNLSQIDLNHINASTGETILHGAIREGDVSQVQRILSHRVDVNRVSREDLSPIALAIRLYSLQEKSPGRLQIIRSLSQYGARINQIPNDLSIQRAIQVGEQMTPIYYTPSPNYEQLDLNEDFALILTETPQFLDDPNYQEALIGTDLQLLRQSIQGERAKSVEGLGWPLFINDTLNKPPICPSLEDGYPEAASPPNTRKVYELALASMKDKPSIPPQPLIIPFTESVPNLNYAYDLIQVTRPLATPPIMPTGSPGLPVLS